jgi:hypothetical protein
VCQLRNPLDGNAVAEVDIAGLQSAGEPIPEDLDGVLGIRMQTWRIQAQNGETGVWPDTSAFRIRILD